ncbi:MAG: putative DNA-binding domain-containing protein [Myxococcales bacterium]|nr:putative DNA-binding domain-containing protein [Myxococcales bacterium]
MSLDSQQKRIAELCLTKHPDIEHADAPAASLSSWALYRAMVRHRLCDMIRRGLPRTERVLGPAVFSEHMARYLHETGPVSRYIRDVVVEFAEHLEIQWKDAADVPRVARDLLRYEATCWSVADQKAGLPKATADFAFDRPAYVNPTLRVLEVGHAVHHLDEASCYGACQWVLGVFRNARTQKVETVALDPLEREVIEVWLAHPDWSAKEGIEHAFKTQKLPLSAGRVTGLCERLPGFIESGLIAGAVKTL